MTLDLSGLFCLTTAAFITGLLVIDLLRAYAYVVTVALALVASVPFTDLATAAEGRSATISGKYHITDAEKAACAVDAITFCSQTYPDEDRLLACLRANRANLGSLCRPVFEAGMKRRGLR